MLANASCDGQECDTSIRYYGCPSADVSPDDPCCKEGDLIDGGNTWESTPSSADWLDYPGFRTWYLYTAGWTGNRVPTGYLVYIAPETPPNPYPPNDPPDAPVSLSTLASGNLAELPYFGAGLIEVQNGTCSPFVFRAEIPFSSLPDGGFTPDMIGGCQKKQSDGADASSADGGD
jgi:hypothetical protein